MRLIDEIVAYCDRRGMLSGEQLARLREMGLDESYYDKDALCKKWYVSPPRYENNEDYYDSVWDWDYYVDDLSDEELTEEQARLADVQRAIRRKSGGGGKPVRKKTTAPELDALLAPLLDAMFADALSRCVVKLGARAGIKETSNVCDAVSSLARLSESELLTALTQALDASGCDRLSLNDVYAAILAWPDLTFLKERGGPAVDACRTLLREDYESGVASRDAWLLGESNAVRDLYWYQRFKLGLIAALRTVYETDKATFKRWSTDGGRLPFPGWDEAKKVDTTCWRVWEAVDQTPREVLYAEWKATLACVNSPRTLALCLTLTDSLAFDFSHLTVVDGDYEQFKDAANKPTVARPPLFSAVQTLWLENADDEEARRLKGLPNLQTLTFGGYSSNVTDAGLSSLSCCANLQTLELNGLDGVTDAGLSSLSGCANLQTLKLSGLKNVTGAGLSSLSGCANLQTLKLQWLDGVTDAGLSALLYLPNLRQIVAFDCGINGGKRLEITLDAEGNRRFDGEFGSDFVLKAFAAQFEGDSLELKGNAITDVGLSSLSGCANLQTLELRELSGVTDAGLSSLSGCANLQTLELRYLNRVTDAGLSSLSGGANLRTLAIWYCGVVTDGALAKLAALRGLRSLSLNRCGGFTGVGVAALGAASNLRLLEFWKCDGVSSVDVDALRKRLPNCEIRFTPRD